jgi:hypothetical protein
MEEPLPIESAHQKLLEFEIVDRAINRGDILSQCVALQQLLVLGLEERITSATIPLAASGKMMVACSCLVSVKINKPMIPSFGFRCVFGLGGRCVAVL